MAILLAGGCGYIGSHTAVELIQAGYEVVIADNLSNSSAKVIDRLFSITGVHIPFYEIDVCDRVGLEQVFQQHKIEAVIHFAALKSISESVELPVLYYRNNLDAVLSLIEVMNQFSCKRFVFSSSATVYGDATPPCVETMPTALPTNPYGRTKLMTEQILSDVALADKDFSVVLLRYFNPIGAHESGLIGEAPSGVPANLFPYLTQVAAGERAYLNIYGDDYPTVDGTGVRDYIHVCDLAAGHVYALDYAAQHTGVEIFNLGLGFGYSVRQVVAAFERVVGIPIPTRIAPRRAGDIAESFSNPAKAQQVLGWKAKRNMDDMCRDAWRWQKMNPHGYAD